RGSAACPAQSDARVRGFGCSRIHAPAGGAEPTVTETPKHSVSVAAAIFDKSGENVLLIKRRDNGHWEPPGGVLELDETIEEGLRREVREETGAEIEIGPLTGVYKNMAHGVVALVFRCAARSATTPHTDE